MLAVALAQWSGARVSADVALAAGDGGEGTPVPEPVVGSFTVDGLTYAIIAEGEAALVATAPDAGAADGDGDQAAEVEPIPLAVPASVSYGGADYAVTTLGAYAFAAAGADMVALPATVASIDPRAFRATAVQRIEVDPPNSAFSSHDGALYSADQTRLLLVPGGRQGAVRILSHAEAVEPGALSHGAAVASFSVDEGSAAFSAWDGLLYTADGTTLVAVPAGATEITIREGCTAIAAGALAGCAQLERINAPASLESISPEALSEVPAASAPDSTPSEEEGAVPQISQPLALATAEDAAPAVDPEAVTVALPEGADAQAWERLGFAVEWAAGNDVQEESESDGNGLNAGEANSSPSSGEEGSFLAEVGRLGDRQMQRASYQGIYSYDNPLIFDVYTSSRDSTTSPWELMNHEQKTIPQHYQWGLFDFASYMLGPMQSIYGLDVGEGELLLMDTNAYSDEDLTIRVYVFRKDTNDLKITSVKHQGVSSGYMEPGIIYASAGSGDTQLDIHTATLTTTSTVTLNKNGGTGGDNSITATSGQAMPSATMPTRTGYKFQGYYDTSAANGGTQYYNASGGSARNWDKTSDMTLWARWSPISYYLVYHDKAGNRLLTSEVSYDSTVSLAANPNKTAAGYTAKGWAKSANQTSAAYGFGQSVSNLSSTSGAKVNLYVAETANTYTVSFNANGGSGGQSANVTATYNSAMPGISTTKPTRAGYTFQGWYDTSAASGGTQYYTAACTSARSYNKTSNTTLYARWSGNTIRTTWNPNGGTIDGATGEHYRDTTYAAGLTLNNVGWPVWDAPRIAKTGYTFLGWYTAASGGTRVTTATALPTANTTYYAHWQANTYTINYHSRGGTYLGNQVVTYDGRFSFWNVAGQSTGYTGKGWATSAWQSRPTYGFGATINNIATGGTVNLYLAETPNTYTVSFNANGGSGGQSANVTATYDANMPGISTTKPTRTGYTFQGWWDTSAASGGTQYYTAACASARTWNKTSGATLYARWTANTYNVRYFTKDGTHIGTDQKAYDAWFNLRGDPGRTHAAYTARGWATARNQTSASHAFALWTRNLASAQGANFDLYVAETANTYSISYDTAGGELSGQRTEYTFETVDFQLAEPTRVGYAFAGWKVTGAAAGSAGVATSGTVSTVKQGTWGNLSCVATWRANQYPVALDAAFPEFAMGATYEGYGPYGVSKDGGTASVTATFDSAMPAATMPHATGYAFEGYFDDAGVKYYNADGSSARTWDKPNAATLHGRWTLDRYELTLDVGNGEVPDAAGRGWVRDAGEAGLYRLSYSIEYVKESGGSPRIQLPVSAAKPGYSVFDGWTGPNLAKPSTRVQVQPWELVSKAYTGVFSGLIDYTATLDLAGGRFELAPEGWAEAGGSWAHGFTVESEAFSLPTPVRDGYDFQGWAAVAADGSLGAPAKDVTVPKGSWGDRAWRASWKAVAYRITYDLAGGTMAGQRESYTIEDADFELPAPTRDGYSFQGWEVEGANGAGIGVSGTTSTVKRGTWGDLHATAQWATVSYAVMLALDGGSFATAPEGWSEDGGSWSRGFTIESEAFSLPTPTRAGHDFLGWALVGADGSLGAPVASVTVPKGTWGDRSYRALWQARIYSITWHYSGQTIDGQQSAAASQAYGAPIAFPARPGAADPAREHYEFAGWFTEREGGQLVEAGDYLVEGDSTYYARWSPVEYAVHLHMEGGQVERDGSALPMAPDGHFDMAYTVEDEVRLPAVSDDPAEPRPVREGMEFKGWVECAADGASDPAAIPQLEVVLPAGSHGERHFKAVWAYALRFEVPSAVGFRFDLADDPAFADAPYGPVDTVEGDGVEFRSLSLGRLAIADVALDVVGSQPDDIVKDRSQVSLRVMDATSTYDYGWVPLPTTSAPERLDPYDLADLGFGTANAVSPLGTKPLRYQIEIQDPLTNLVGEVTNLPLAKVVFTVQGLW